MKVMECKHCHAPLDESALASGQDIIVCQFCDTVHNLQPDPVAYSDAPRREKMKREKPDKFTINKLADGIEINYPWLGKQHTGLLFFTLIWNGFIIFFTIMMFGGMASEGDVDGFPVLFLIPFYAVGIGMAYYVIAGFLNRTSVEIRGKGITTRHRPIPMIGTADRSVDRREIAQVYCRRRVAYESNDVPVHVFDVHYVRKGGDDTTLIKGLDNINKAIFIEQQIERLYRISDVEVDGEYRSRFG